MRATGTLRFFLTQAVTVPKGTVCMTAGLVEFITTQAGTLAAGALSVDVPAQAVEPGPGGNIAAGMVRTMALAPVGLSGCSNPAAFTGGAAREEDEALRARVLESYRHPSSGTTAAYSALAAMEVEGVAAVSVLPKKRGLGTVDVVIAQAGGLPSAGLVEQVQAVLEEKREVAVSVLVRAPETVSVNVVAPVVQRVRETVRAWFDGSRLGGDVLVAQLRQVIFQVEGVANYRLGAPISDVAVEKDVLPVLGSLTVEEMV